MKQMEILRGVLNGRRRGYHNIWVALFYYSAFHSTSRRLLNFSTAWLTPIGGSFPAKKEFLARLQENRRFPRGDSREYWNE